MCRGLSRNYSQLASQHIDLSNLIKYVDNLKSRIYKTFIKKVSQEIPISQLYFLSSPLVIYLAINVSRLDDINFNSFELGYLISFFNLEPRANFLFFNHYRQNRLLQLTKQFDDFINEINYIRINWIVEVYIQYLYYLNNSSYIHIYRQDILCFFNCQKFNSPVFAITIDLNSCIYYIDIMNMINKSLLIDYIKNCIYNFLDTRTFIKLSTLLNLSEVLSVLKKNDLSLVEAICKFFVLSCLYEVSNMLSIEFNLNTSIERDMNIMIIGDGYSFLAICQKPVKLNLWKKHLLCLLTSYGVDMKINKKTISHSLNQGIDFKRYFIFLSDDLYLNPFCIRPSLNHQFILLRLISLIFLQSISSSLLLLIIRFNKLLLSWSACYRSKKFKKIFCLLDYLVSMKYKRFVRHRNFNYFQKKINFLYPQFYNCTKYYAKSTYIIASISDEFYYHQYATIKLLWLD